MTPFSIQLVLQVESPASAMVWFTNCILTVMEVPGGRAHLQVLRHNSHTPGPVEDPWLRKAAEYIHCDRNLGFSHRLVLA